MKYAFVDTHRTGWDVERLCAALGVSRSGYYAWRACPESRRTSENQALLTRIRAVHTEAREAYGAVKTWRVLRAQGVVGSYIHGGGKIGVLLEVNCETDFVARTEEFQKLVKDVAMQIAAANPRYVRRDEVSDEERAREREIYRVQTEQSGKPAAVMDRIVDGKMEKFFSDICLMEQPFIREPGKTIEQLLKEVVARTGENVVIHRFARFQIGEGEGSEAAAGQSA